LHTIDEYVDKYYPENKRVRPRVAIDDIWEKDIPVNPIGWAIRITGQDLGNCNIL
jgi:hypothetical protein